MSATATESVPCPKCGGLTWDNRATKKNPKAPDYKCRDKSCDGVIWPPREGRAPAKASVPASAKQAVSIGVLPGVDDEANELRAVTTEDEWGKLRRIYGECLLFAAHDAAQVLTKADIGATPETVASIAATLFITRTRRAA